MKGGGKEEGDAVPEGGSIPDHSSLRGCLSHTAEKHFAIHFFYLAFVLAISALKWVGECYLFVCLIVFNL